MQNIPSSELTQEQRLTVQKWFDEKMAGGVIGKCGMCGSRSWTLVEHLVAPPTWNSGGGMLIGGISFPMVMITCQNCGNTHFHSAVMIGLVSSDLPADPAKPEAKEEEKGAADG
jgi:hypothetical protein